ncbi:hypothetical protein BKA93DRAFT_318714 [Sparassis latifolia]
MDRMSPAALPFQRFASSSYMQGLSTGYCRQASACSQFWVHYEASLDLGRLRTVNLSFLNPLVPVEIVDSDMHAMATSWPALEQLFIGSLWLSNNIRGPSIYTLEHFASRCPKLSFLSCGDIDVAAAPQQSISELQPSTCSTAMRRLVIPYKEIPLARVKPLVQFLTQIFPNVELHRGHKLKDEWPFLTLYGRSIDG